MHLGRTAFSRPTDFVLQYEFRQIVKDHKGEDRVRCFSEERGQTGGRLLDMRESGGIAPRLRTRREQGAL